MPGVRPLQFRQAVYRNLCCWDQATLPEIEPGEMAFDPARGRFRFRAGEEAAGEITVDFRFALTGEVGAGPCARGELPETDLTVAQSRNAKHATIQAAINAAPQGKASSVIIDILDSRTYSEALLIDNRNFPGGLILRAAALAMPVLAPPAGNALAVTATSTIGDLRLEGLVLSGGNVIVEGDVPRLTVRYLSLDPESVRLSYSPVNGEAQFESSSSILGPIELSPNVAAASLSDSIVQHPDSQVDTPNGHVALAATGFVDLNRVSVLGEIAGALLKASNSTLIGNLAVADPEASCLRYSRHPKGVVDFRRYRSTTAFPILISTRFGHGGYFRLHPNTSEAIRRGAEEGGEMGAFYRAGTPWREQNLHIRLGEFLPAGLGAVLVQALPNSSRTGELPR